MAPIYKRQNKTTRVEYSPYKRGRIAKVYELGQKIKYIAVDEGVSYNIAYDII